jgi:hypothetical protein
MVEMHIIDKSNRSLTGSRLLLGCLILAGLAAGCLLPANAQPRAETALSVAGTLRVVNARHPNGTAIRALQVVATTPLALPDEFCERGKPLRTFHLVPKDQDTARKLDALVGRQVAIRGSEIFCSHTAWHIGDAVVLRAEPMNAR